MKASVPLMCLLLVQASTAGVCAAYPTCDSGLSFNVRGRHGPIAQCVFMVTQARRTDWDLRFVDVSTSHAFQVVAAANGHLLWEAQFLENGARTTLVRITGRWRDVQEDVATCAQSNA